MVILLAEVAKQKGLTQTKLSELTQMPQSALSRFFSAKHTPSLSTYLQIAKSIGVNFFFEDVNGTSDLSIAFENAMNELGRRVKPSN